MSDELLKTITARQSSNGRVWLTAAEWSVVQASLNGANLGLDVILADNSRLFKRNQQLQQKVRNYRTTLKQLQRAHFINKTNYENLIRTHLDTRAMQNLINKRLEQGERQLAVPHYGTEDVNDPQSA